MSDPKLIGKTVMDDRMFWCPSCSFTGGEDAMVEHAQVMGHVALPEHRGEDREDEDEHARMMDEGCPNG